MGNHLRRKPVTTIERITCRSGHAARSHILIDARLSLQCLVGSFAEFERAMIRERTTTGLTQARAEGRIGGRRKKLDPKKRREIAESVLPGRKSRAEMARLYDVSEPTVSRIVAEHRQTLETLHADQP